MYGEKMDLSLVALKEAGKKAFLAQDYHTALSYYKQATSNYPAEETAWFNQGLTHKNLKQFAEAITSFKQALALKTDYAKAHSYLTQVYLETDAYQDAWRSATSYLAQNPNDVAMLKLKNLAQGKIGAQITTAIVDLKLTPDGKVKILEFGDLFQSGTTAFNSINPNETIRDRLCAFLEKQQPPSYINSQCGIDVVDDHHFVQTLQQGQAWPTRMAFDPANVATYRGIYAGRSYLPVPDDILRVNAAAATQLICEDKEIMHQLMVKCEGKEDIAHRPACRSYPMQYRANLAEEIKQTIPSPSGYYILKKPDVPRGEGIVLVAAADLNKKLKQLLRKGSASLNQIVKDMAQEHKINPNTAMLDPEQIQRAIQQSMNLVSWHSSDTPRFLVEALTPSKLIHYHQQQYDATMRVYFIIVRDQGQSRFVPLGCAWKLPPQPITAGAHTRDNVVSSYTATHSLALAVSEEDQTTVYQQLAACLPKYFDFLYCYDVPAYIEKILNTTHDEDYTFYLCGLLCNHYTIMGEHFLAENLFPEIEKYGKAIPARIIYQKAKLAFFRGDYQQAINGFQASRKYAQTIPVSIIYEARAQLKLGNIPAAILCIAQTAPAAQTLLNVELQQAVNKNYTMRINDEPVSIMIPDQRRAKSAAGYSSSSSRHFQQPTVVKIQLTDAASNQTVVIKKNPPSNCLDFFLCLKLAKNPINIEPNSHDRNQLNISFDKAWFDTLDAGQRTLIHTAIQLPESELTALWCSHSSPCNRIK